MSEQPIETPATDAPNETIEQPKPTETVDFWKQKAREQEKRAKENAGAAQRLNDLEAANKSEIEKANDRVTAAERERDQARAEGLRLRIAAKHGISDEDADLFLTGNDEDTLTKQAQRLTDRDADRKKHGNFSPREGTSNPSVEGDEREFARNLFGG